MLGFESGDIDDDHVEKGSHSRKSLKWASAAIPPQLSFNSSDGTSTYGKFIIRLGFCIDLEPTLRFQGCFMFLGVEWFGASLRLMCHSFRLLILQPRYSGVRQEAVECLISSLQELSIEFLLWSDPSWIAVRLR
jgi:hypothetical protein